MRDAKKSKMWVYGKSANPNNWREASEAIMSQERKHGKPSIWKKLDEINKLLKEKK